MKNTKYYLAFSHFFGIGPIRFKHLVSYFGSPKNAYHANTEGLRKVLGSNLAEKFVAFRKNFSADSIEDELLKKNIQVLTLEDKDYPEPLAQISDPPICLYVKGNKEILAGNKRQFAIVGTRKPTSYGLQVAEKFASELAQYGFIIVSGMAAGIDSAAQWAAINAIGNTNQGEQQFVGGVTGDATGMNKAMMPVSNDLGGAQPNGSEASTPTGVRNVVSSVLSEKKAPQNLQTVHHGKTIAVLGCGVDIVYPPSNQKLYEKIIETGGAIVSEFPPGHTVLKGLFVARNRIISGLSKGVLVVEGAKDSGSLITARYAAEQGRDVFAPPSPITSPLSEAPNILLKQGAKLVTEVSDILEEYDIKIKTKEKEDILKNLSGLEKEIVEIIINEPKTADELAQILKKPIDAILNSLTLLEIQAVVKKNEEGRFFRKVT